ncbi:MAG: toll/interleukin-1 receptor domain-containing protein [Paramuribaculum sp.]|nr:toll/interleukin-1 receptor domain-containing protein [Paramuribaculum sp.]
MHKDVFISYSRKDTAIADKICAALDNANISYFIDRDGISGGAEFQKILAEAIQNCKVFLYLASTNSYASKYAKKEVSFALKKCEQAILPYIIDDAEMPAEMELNFADLNCRNLKEHPIDTTLLDDICTLVGKEMEAKATDTAALISRNVHEIDKDGHTVDSNEQSESFTRIISDFLAAPFPAIKLGNTL